MDAVENLHYAIGQLAYAVAKADGKIQKEERQKFHNIVAAELRCNDYGFNVSDIIFKIMDKENYPSTKDAYEWAMNQIKLNSHYLSPQLKQTFIQVMRKIAESFPPVTAEEMQLLKKFEEDIAPIHGDPVYYEKKH